MMMLGGRTKLNRLFPDRLHNLGRWGVVCNLVAVFFVLQALVIYCFPATYPVTADNMNYGASSLLGAEAAEYERESVSAHGGQGVPVAVVMADSSS